MEIVTMALLLLLAVVASGALAQMLPGAIPMPLVQIALGFAIGIGTGRPVALDPDLFFLLFLPPLLFLDGWRIPKDALARDIGFIVELSLALVVFTVFGAAYLIHWMIPALPLATAFALAAVLSPTDPIAVSTIAARVRVPPRLMHILEGESMFNDASGLVCLRFAVAAALSGRFSLAHASLSFLWMAIAGLTIGAGVTLGVVRLRDWLTRARGDDAGMQVLLSLLIPFGAYLLAEEVEASGILAAVAAGVAMTYAERTGGTEAGTRVRRASVWDVIQFAGNGVIFVLLGEQLPQILDGAARAAQTHGAGAGWWLLGDVVAITLGLGVLRFAWVWASLRLTLFRRRDARPFRSSNLRLVATLSFAGVRGALTLAGILTLPMALADGTPFPGREFAIFLAAGVIILSLVLASVALPLLLGGPAAASDPDEAADLAEEDRVRIAVYQAAVHAIETLRRRHAGDADEADGYAAAAERIASVYRARIEAREHPDPVRTRRREAIEAELNLAAMHAARTEILRLSHAREAGSLLARRIVRELDLLELRFVD